MSTNLGPHGIDLTAPGGIAALLDFHRRTFGDARMEGEAGAAAAGTATAGTGTAAAASTVAANGAATTTETAKAGKADAGDHGFPASTPVAEMTGEQREAYWKFHARKHEERATATADRDTIAAELAALKARTQTDEEKAVEAAKTAAKAEGRRELLPALVQAEFRAAAGGRLAKEQIEVILAPLDPTKFLTADGGQVDTDKVQQYVDGIAPAGKKWPDMGQGKRGTSQATAGVSAGRALYADRHPAKK
jgi:hypothetical protein